MASDRESSSDTIPSIRISGQQLQKLEDLFMECKNPEKKLREKWSLELGMKPAEIKNWFKNKMFKLKIEKKREENDALRLENARICKENIEMRMKLKNICGSCLKNQVLEDLRRENVELKEKHQKMSNFVQSLIKGPPQVDLELRLAPPCFDNGEVDLELKLAPSYTKFR